MKKTFPLEDPRHKPARVLDAIKHEVRKYLKRERRKRLPEEADFWAFDCQVGQDGPTKVVELAEVIPAIDAASEQGWSTVYIEILARPAKAADKPANKPSDPPSDPSSATSPSAPPEQASADAANKTTDSAAAQAGGKPADPSSENPSANPANDASDLPSDQADG